MSGRHRRPVRTRLLSAGAAMAAAVGIAVLTIGITRGDASACHIFTSTDPTRARP